MKINHMGRINILLANADNYFTNEEIQIIHDAVHRAEVYISSKFNEFDYDLDLLVARPSYMQDVIPEDGICGRTFRSRLLTVVIDKDQFPVSADAIYETTCHELSHSLRWEKVPEYAETLFDGMILEGLAVALEEQAVKDAQCSKVHFFLQNVQATTDEEYQKMITTLGPLFEKTEYDYETIFYTGDDTLPRWAGYKLGYYYVKKYLSETGHTIEEATLESYKNFIRQASWREV